MGLSFIKKFNLISYGSAMYIVDGHCLSKLSIIIFIYYSRYASIRFGYLYLNSVSKVSFHTEFVYRLEAIQLWRVVGCEKLNQIIRHCYRYLMLNDFGFRHEYTSKKMTLFPLYHKSHNHCLFPLQAQNRYVIGNFTLDLVMFGINFSVQWLMLMNTSGFVSPPPYRLTCPFYLANAMSYNAIRFNFIYWIHVNFW